ncbi:response regulator transcription factor [Lysobacter korlensis]|uniref:Response regulator transcription factor n=1 Tax=Lysobacter korlensis TaxID=553636 RepID=A0ABV6RXT0_9GAMM
MASTLLAQRVAHDVDLIARAGLPIDEFLDEAMGSLARAVPFVSACVPTVDPATMLVTGVRKFGGLTGLDHRDHEWALIEYGTSEPDSFAAVARSAVPATAVHLATGGHTERSARLTDFMVPEFGFTDELRAAFRSGRETWGGMALFRDEAANPFTPEEVELVAELSSAMALGLRTGLLAQLAYAPPVAPVGPAVLIVNADNEFVQLSAGAEQRLADLNGRPTLADPMNIISALVGAARSWAAGQTDLPPRCRVRSASGMWLVLHATPLSARDGKAGDVVVTIDEARPPEIVPLVVAAFGLTARERDVTQLVLQGVDTKEIASTIHVSTYTVQDHLKSVFDKVGVRSRRELIARVYFDQYVPRMGGELGASGWFAGS